MAESTQNITRRSEIRLKAIIDAEPACLKIVSADGILVDMNRAGLEMVGATDLAQVVGRNVFDLVHPADRDRYLRMHRLTSEGTPSTWEFRISMTLRPVLAVLVALGLSAAALGAQTQFTLLTTVVDPASGTPVEALTSSDVSVTEDGVTATIVKIEPVVLSVKVQVLIDNGAGMGRNIVELRTGVRGLMKRIPPDTETAIVTTSPQPRFLVRATKNRAELLKGIDRLAPDSGAGRFTESLAEAAERANKDKDAFTVIITAGSTSGDARILDSEIQQALDRINGKPMIVHVLLYAGEKSASGGVSQVDVGERAAQMTGGRYEFINSMSRYSTLLPEFGNEVAKQLTGSTRQFRLTVQRPQGKKGDLGEISVISSSKTISGLWRE